MPTSHWFSAHPARPAECFTEIHALRGQMVGAPALLLATHRSGRVLLSPPHPEETVPRLDDVVEAYVLYASGAL